MRVTFAQLRALQAVARTGNVTRAANHLGTTQPAVSHAIRNLERELDLALLVRRSDGVALTPAGRAVHERATAILTQLEGLQQVASAARGDTSGQLRIGVIPSVGAQVLPRVLRAFGGTHPRIRVTVFEGADAEVLEWLQTGAVDVGTVTGAAAGLRATPLVRDRLVAVLPVDHPLSAAAEVSLADLAHEPFVMSTGGCEPLIADVARRAAVDLRIHYRVRDTASILAMVAERLGVTVFPELALPARTSGICAVALTLAERRTVNLAVIADAPTLPAATEFIEVAVQAVAAPEPAASV